MRTTSNIILASLVIAASGAAIAQAPPAPATPPQATAPPSTATQPPTARPQDRPNRATAPDGTTTGQSREPLGDKLAKSDGVLCPPSGVDPEMHAPAPSTDGAHARHPAPRQPRRRPHGPAEIGDFRASASSPLARAAGRGRNPRKARISGEGDSPRVQCGKRPAFRRRIRPCGALGEGGRFGLTSRRPLPYMPRVREIGLFRPSRPCGGVAQLVRARES